MNFVAPEFLYALGFLAIPILIHLFNFRRYKTVKFSQVRFLKNIKKQTQSTSKLKHLLILLSRCLALAALIIAFAQPYVSNDEEIKLGKKGVIVYIDNSFSMQMQGSAGSLLDLSKTKALSILDAYSETDRFQLHTNDFGGNDQRWLNKEAFINKLRNLDYSPFFRSIQQVLPRLKTEGSEDFILKHYLISDLQKINFSNTEVIDSTKYHIIPVIGTSDENAWVDQLESYNPYHLEYQAEKLTSKLKKSSSENKSFNGSLTVNDKLKSPFSVDFLTDTLIHELNYKNDKSNAVKGVLALKDYPVTFDDEFYFSYNMQEPIKVLHIYDERANKNIAALYKSDSIINYSVNSLKQIDFNAIQNSSLVILDELQSISSGVKDALNEFIKLGGSVSVFPSKSMDIKSVNLFLNELGIGYYSTKMNDSNDVSLINTSAQLFQDVFEEEPKQINLPKANSYWKVIEPRNTIRESIFTFRDGSVFLTKYTIGEGAAYISAVGLNEQESNFQGHALFVPVLFNMALQSVNPTSIAYFLQEQKIEIDLNEKSESPLVLTKGDLEFIPKQEIRSNKAILSIGNKLKDAGHYELKRDDKVLQYLSFNYNRKESDLSKYSVAELKEEANGMGLNLTFFESDNEFLSETIKDNGLGQDLWKYFVVLTLIFLSLEILLLRILK